MEFLLRKNKEFYDNDIAVRILYMRVHFKFMKRMIQI